MAASFRAVRLARPGLPDLPPGRPLVVYSNHPSWWDPAFGIVLHARLFPGREGYAPIRDAMLERYPGAAASNFDSLPGVSEMDALVAYLQVLGTMAEFDWRRPDPAMLR